MRIRTFPAALAAVAAVLLASIPAHAQTANAAVFGTYYDCDQNRETVADLIQRNVMGPILDGFVDSGDLISWGWLSHRVGGDWRRAEYMIAPDRATLMKVRNQYIEALQAGDDAQLASRELTAICPDHNDYIWAVEASSSPDALAQSREGVSMSTYYECDVSREGRADEIVDEVLGPIYNQHVGEGAFTSWSWLSHQTGGKIRRLFTVGAADEETLMNHQDALIAQMQREAPEAVTEFDEICNSHVDYLWDVTISSP